MGYYDNPPIIQRSKGSEIVSASIVNAASAFSQGLMKRAERQHQERKEHKLALKELQERKNETDLHYTEKIGNWYSKQNHTYDAADTKINELAQQKITKAADSTIALLNETDQKKRAEYLKDIRNANTFLDSSAKAGKSIAEKTATWRKTKGIKVGEVGGYVVNGKNKQERIENTGFLEIMGGMDSLYKDVNVDISDDNGGDALIITVSGKDKNGTAFTKSVNSNVFNKNEQDDDDTLLAPVESFDTFFTKSKEDIVDKKDGIYPVFLQQTHETVDLASKGDSDERPGGDIYQMVNGRKLNEPLIKSTLKTKSDISADGILSADTPTRLRTLLDYTLKQGEGYFDDTFSIIKDPQQQKNVLSKILSDNSWNEMTKMLEKSPNAQGGFDYWNPDGSSIKLKDKTTAAELRAQQNFYDKQNKADKELPTTYKSENYDAIIQGYNPTQGENLSSGQVNYRTRIGLVENLNKLSGENAKYLTREEVFKKYENSRYKKGTFDTGKTMKEAYADGDIKGDIKQAFDKVIPKGEILTKEGAAYKAVKGYNVNSAEGRIKLALDQTANEGERKILQNKIPEARLMDWVKNNPKKSNESQEQYAARARKRN